MLDDYAKSQPFIYRTIQNSIKKDRCSHAYIIEDNGSKEAFNLAKSFAKYLFCPIKHSNLNDCGNCKQCETIDNDNFLELKIIKPDGMWIKKNQLEQLQKEFKTKSLSTKRIYIILNAEKMNPQTANSILKFIEEPVEGIIALLVVENLYQLLPTIVSRCQILSLNTTKEHSLIDKIKAVIPEITDEEFNIKEQAIIELIKSIEGSPLDTIAKINQLYFKQFKDNMNLGLELLFLNYKSILNIKIKQENNEDNEYKETIEEVIKNNTENILCQKIKIILKAKENLKSNLNPGLLIDKLLIDLERIKK